MKFKVGDRVKVSNSWSGNTGNVGEITERNGVYHYPYYVTFKVGNDESFREDDLELVEEEKVMKFKVGDKVKVSNSWFGFTDEVGVIASVEDQEPEFKYTVKFNVEDGETKEESFREEELELVKEKAEKQSFTKSDLKTGMGVVLRDGSKGHVLIGTGLDDIIKDIEKSQWIKIKAYSEELTCRGYQNLDIVEVYTTEYENKFLSDRMFDGKAVYVREEPKPEPEPTKMTMKEINEHFGKPIEIVE